MPLARDQATKVDEPLTGLRKVAVLLVSLSKEAASVILKKLEPDQIERVSREIASLEQVPSGQRDEVINEFYHLSMARTYAETGGLDYARILLEQALPKEQVDHIIRQLESEMHSSPFSALQKTESEHLLAFVQEEHPQVLALLLAHLPNPKASEILSRLPAEKQTDVISRIAGMKETNPDIVKEVEKALQRRLAEIGTQKFEQTGGAKSVAGILNSVDRSTEKAILEALEGQDPDLAEEIRRLMIVFDDIVLVDDKGIQAVLKEVDNDQLALAMRTATDEVKEKIFSNMSERAAKLIQEDMEYSGPVRLSNVEAAQQNIVDVVRRLEEAGEIFLSGRGGEKELLV